METLDHQELKALACEWLIRQGARVVATEVAAPVPRWRVDAAAWIDGRDHAFHKPGHDAPLFESSAPHADPVTTVVVECKQSRADFFRDAERVDGLIAERDRLSQRCRDLEETRVKVYEPHLRRAGSTLFSDLDEWDFAASRISAYRTALAELRRIEEALYGHTKFGLIPRYRLADRCLIFGPRGMLKPWEVPAGWGLVECGRRELLAGAARLPRDVALPVRVVRHAPHHACAEHHKSRWLRNIAVASTRAWLARDMPEHPNERAAKVDARAADAARESSPNDACAASPAAAATVRVGPGSSVG